MKEFIIRAWKRSMVFSKWFFIPRSVKLLKVEEGMTREDVDRIMKENLKRIDKAMNFK